MIFRLFLLSMLSSLCLGASEATAFLFATPQHFGQILTTPSGYQHRFASPSCGSVIGNPQSARRRESSITFRMPVLNMVARYGPPPSSLDDASIFDDDDEKSSHTTESSFRAFLESCVETSSKDPNHLPKLMADNIDLIMSLHGSDGTQVIKEFLDDAKYGEGEKHYQRISEVVDVVLSFAEELVDFSIDLDDHNKHLLGEIILIMTKQDVTSLQKEEELDEWLHNEKHNFTPGFLRHIEGECTRIANAPKLTRESSKLLEILRIIQTRVLEELGHDIGGEAALVLGQLMGYDDDEELLGVLGAGLTVRGRDFALDMSSLTEEALDGFQRVPGGTDPGLVERVTVIDRRLKEFLDENDRFL